MDWRIYYADGATFDSSQGAPDDTRPTGVAVIVQRDANGSRYIVKGENYYFWGGPLDQWRGADRDAVIEAVIEGETVEGFCQGRRQTRVGFHELLRAANADPDFQP